MKRVLLWLDSVDVHDHQDICRNCLNYCAYALQHCLAYSHAYCMGVFSMSSMERALEKIKSCKAPIQTAAAHPDTGARK